MFNEIRTSLEEVQKLSEWSDGHLSCPEPTKPFALVCYRNLARVQSRIERMEHAEPGLAVMAIIFVAITVGVIVSLGFYVRHLKRKLEETKQLCENSTLELDRPFDMQENNDVSSAVIKMVHVPHEKGSNP